MLKTLSRGVRALGRHWTRPHLTNPRSGGSPRAERRRAERRTTYRTDATGAMRRTTPKRSHQ